MAYITYMQSVGYFLVALPYLFRGLTAHYARSLLHLQSMFVEREAGNECVTITRVNVLAVAVIGQEEAMARVCVCVCLCTVVCVCVSLCWLFR